MSEDKQQSQQNNAAPKTKKCPKCMMDVDERAERCGHCGHEFNQAKKFAIGCLGLLILYVVISANYKPATPGSPTKALPVIVQTSNINPTDTADKKMAAVIDIPSLFTKHLTEMKDELTQLCGKDAVAGFDPDESEKTKVVTCLINKKYDIYFELTPEDLITSEGVRLIGFTQSGDSEDSVLSAAGVTRGMAGYNVVIKPADAAGQIVLDVTKEETNASDNSTTASQEAKDYYSNLLGYSAVVTRTFSETIANSDLTSAYLDFKGDAGYKISGARQSLYELSLNPPKGPDQQLLAKAADSLATGAYKVEESVKLFEEGVENNSNGKILEATAAAQKGTEYFKTGKEYLDQFAAKYNLGA